MFSDRSGTTDINSLWIVLDAHAWLNENELADNSGTSDREVLSQYNSIDENSSDDGKVVADNVKDLEYTDKDVDTDLEIMFEDLVSCSEAEIDNLLREYDDTSEVVNCETGEDGQVEKITIYEKVDISQDSLTSDACSEQFVYQDIRLRQEKKMVNKKTEKEAKTGRNCASFILIWGK